MASKGAAVGGILWVIALVLTIAYFVYSNQITQLNVQQANEDLKKAQSDMDVVVNTAIIHCEQNPDDACNVIMKQWQDKCQESDMKDIPSCHDGRIEFYFKNIDLNSVNSIPQTNTETQTTSSHSSNTSSIDNASINALNSCSDLIQSINDARQQLADEGSAYQTHVPLSTLSPSPDMVYNEPIHDSQKDLKSCRGNLYIIQQQCVKYPSMSVCEDPRLKQLNATISNFIYSP